MTLAELFEYLEAHTAFDILDGSAAETVHKVLEGTHRNALSNEILLPLIQKNDCSDADCALERAAAVASLGAVRLKYMADDAPVEGFRMVEGIIKEIDAAFNAEALQLKQQG